MRIDELNRPLNQEAATLILKNGGWENTASGYYGDIYTKPGANYVLKLFDTRDRAYTAFVNLVLVNPNPHFPKFIGKPIKVTPRYYAIRMEILQNVEKVSGVSLGTYIHFKTNGIPSNPNAIFHTYYEDTMDYLDKHPSLKDALDLIIDNLIPQFSSDLHWDNIMARPDGTWVIIDPVAPHLG